MSSARDLRSLLNNRRTTSALSRHFDRVVEQMIRELTAGISKPGAARVKSLLAEIDRLSQSLSPTKKGFVRDWIKENVPKGFILGDKGATQQLNRDLKRFAAGEDFGKVNASFSRLSETQLRAVTNQMERSLDRAATGIRDRVGVIIRKTQVTLNQSKKIQDATVGGVIRGRTGQEISDDIAAELLGKKVDPKVRQRLKDVGFTAEDFESFELVARRQLIRVGSKTFNVRDYADLVADTQLGEIHKVGTITRLQQNDVNHVQISKHKQKVLDECTPFAGKVFYIGPEAKDPLGFPKLSSIPNAGPPFHPRCGHVVLPYIVAFKSEKVVDEARERAKTLNGKGIIGKKGSKVRTQLGKLTPKELQEILA